MDLVYGYQDYYQSCLQQVVEHTWEESHWQVGQSILFDSLLGKKTKGGLDNPLYLMTYFEFLLSFHRNKVAHEGNTVRVAAMHCDVFYPDLNIQDEVGAVKFLQYAKVDRLIESGSKKMLRRIR